MTVLCDGCFDPLHIGHIRYLKEAAKLGRPVVVNIAPDAAIEAKGRRPFQARIDRGTTVLALDMVDAVRFQSLEDAIRDVKPRYLVKGNDWYGHLPDAVLAACQDMDTRIVYTNTRMRSSSERLRA